MQYINYKLKENIENNHFNTIKNNGQTFYDELISNIQTKNVNQEDFGWINTEEWANSEILENIIQLANNIRDKIEIFIISGVGGSNQAARAVIEALSDKISGPEIIYIGNNLSADYYNSILKRIKGKKVHLNVIAKNFETIEPGIGFRLLYDAMKVMYGKDIYKSITITGSKGSESEKLSKENGFQFLEFPKNVGGRFTAHTAVALFPLSVAGVNIKQYIKGAQDYENQIVKNENKDVLNYAAYRNYLYEKDFAIEALSTFEPELYWFSKWWEQLFAESEGKMRKGIFPITLIYSEQLHSLGQYVQDGRNFLFETFLIVQERDQTLKIPKNTLNDNFDYLDEMPLSQINKIAEEATIESHLQGGVPISIIEVPEINEYYIGQLFYFFEVAVYISGKLLNVNPFNQPGVEGYKNIMFKKLKNNKSTI